MLPKLKKSSPVASSIHEQTKPNAAPRTGLARAVHGLVTQLFGARQGLEASRKIPSCTLKCIFKPVAWAKPANAERWLHKVLDSAIQSLPDKVLVEMSKFPQFNHSLAEKNPTSLIVPCIWRVKSDQPEYATNDQPKYTIGVYFCV